LPFDRFRRLALALLFAATPAAARDSDLVLTGTISRADHQQYRDVPFRLPAGTARLVVAFDHDMRDQKTVIDLGVNDPHGTRGASGGNKSSFSIAATDATPAYLAGRLEPGRWSLALAIPNIRPGVTARWTARLWFLKAGEPEPLAPAPIDRGSGWYRGDFHLHSAHSDGTCAGQTGVRAPCPVARTLAAAAARGLDFVVLTDHNTLSQLGALREAAAVYDRMLLIPGEEVTGFFGHYLALGIETPIDPRLSFNANADRIHAEGGLVAIAHPALPSGEACMGCGWTDTAADLGRVDAIEVVNGSAVAVQNRVEGPLSGIDFWVANRLRGPLAAIGGSDNHDPLAPADRPGAVGRPTTVVHADHFDRAGILAGVRAGRVFIDMDGAGLLDFAVTVGTARAVMGQRLTRPAGVPLVAEVTVTAPPGARVEILTENTVIASARAGDAALRLELSVPAGARLLRAVVRGADGQLLLVGNAVTLVDQR
jgi:hypothetical protein